MIVSRVVATLRVYGILIVSQTCICSSLMTSIVCFAVLCFLTSSAFLALHSGWSSSEEFGQSKVKQLTVRQSLFLTSKSAIYDFKP